MANHALVFGATGVLGWAIVNELLNGYPSPDSFEKVTTLSNRPITENALWPESKKLQVVSGIDLLTENGQEELERDMKKRISGMESVSHVFCCGNDGPTVPNCKTLTSCSLYIQAGSG